MAQVDVQLNRITNSGPTLKEIRVKVANHPPSARCQSVYVSATDDTSANGGLGSSATNQFAIDGVVGSAVAGVCTAGAAISIDDGSFDSDTQEADQIVSRAIVRLLALPRLDWPLFGSTAFACLCWALLSAGNLQHST
jgi:hypothetical protein